MRKTLLALICLAMACPSLLKAQTPHNTLAIGAGPTSLVGGFVYGSIGFWEGVGGSISKRKVKLNMYGEYGLQYYYQVKPWCQVGVKALVEGAKVTRYTDTTATHIETQYRMSIFSVLPSVRFTYLNRQWVRLYSGAEVGCAYIYDSRNFLERDSSQDNSESKTTPFAFAFNVTPIGVEVGKGFFGFVETNVGYDALIKAGIGCRF